MILLCAGDVWQGSLSYGLASGLPLHMFVSCFWDRRVVPFAAWRKSSLTLVSLLWVPYTISYSFHLGWRLGWLLKGGLARLSQLWSWARFPRAFLYVCLSVVAGAERSFHKHHEARAHWHCLHFFGCLVFSLSLPLSLSPIHSIWVEGLALQGRSG